MKMVKTVLLVLAVVLLAASLPIAAAAQAKKKDKKKGGGPIILEEIVIEGRVQKPQAFYILQRSSFGYEITEIEADYIDDVIDSVKDEVF